MLGAQVGRLGRQIPVQAVQILFLVLLHLLVVVLVVALPRLLVEVVAVLWVERNLVRQEHLVKDLLVALLQHKHQVIVVLVEAVLEVLDKIK